MREDVIQKLVDENLLGKLTFPEVLKTLSQEGVESYQVDFLRNENRYYGVNGESIMIKAGHSISEIPEKFSVEAFKKVLKEVQNGKIDYVEFCKATKALGCSYYVVFINGRQVHYMGRNGEQYIEHFPS